MGLKSDATDVSDFRQHFDMYLPIMFFAGIIKFLFVPLALAVAYAMGASYVASLTLAPSVSPHSKRLTISTVGKRNEFRPVA